MKKLLYGMIAIVLLILPASAMGGSFTIYPATTAVTSDDLLLITDEPSGTPSSKKLTFATLFTANDILNFSGTFTDGKYCTYASSGKVLSCNADALSGLSTEMTAFLGSATDEAARTELGLGSMALETATDYVAKSLYDAYSVLYADSDNTPAKLTISANTFLGRKNTGGIVAISGGANKYVGWDADGKLDAYEQMQLGDDAAQFIGKTAGHLGLFHINMAGSTTAKTRTIVSSHTDDRSNTIPDISGNFAITIASGSLALATSEIASAACQTVSAGSVNSAAATGVVTTDVISFTPNATIKAVTGYVPATTGGLTITAYPTSGYVNFDVCNWTAGAVTPGAVTVNWRVSR